MSVIFSKKWFFERNENEFLRYIHKKNGHTLTKDNLTYSFLDLDGNAYYKFPKDLALPMERMGKLHEYMMWLSAGITGQELDLMLDYADKLITEGLTKGKNGSKVGFILSDIKERKNKIIHPELFYNIIAVQTIRWDESVTSFNNDIQLEKVEAFKRLNNEDDTFFLNIREYLVALNWSNISRIELLNILKQSTFDIKTSLSIVGKICGVQSEEMSKILNTI
jgi:hypothetical protein